MRFLRTETRRWAATTVMVAAVLLGAVAVLLSTGPFARATTTTSPALFNRTTLDYSSTLSTAQEASRYQVIVLQSTDASEVAALHAANPNLKILMNSLALYSYPADSTGIGTCTPYSSDNSSDPSWFLKDQHGNRIVDNGRSLMDMGNSGYQQACVAHVVALAKEDGFDGVMLGGFSAQTGSLVPSGTTVEEYPTTADWDAAMQSFLNYAGKTIEADGLYATASLGGLSQTLWQQWSAPLNGAVLDGWTDGGQGTVQQAPFWSTKLAEVAWSEAHDKLTLLDSYNTTEAGNTYGLASMLLVANGNTSYGTDNGGSGSSENWFPEYADAQELGAPQGAYTQLSNGDYERKFSNGVVLVNPTTSSTAATSLGGTYSNGSADVTSESLAPTSGAILLDVPPGPSPALFNRTSYAYSSSLTYAQEAARYQVIILTSLDASKVAALHAANPDLKILMYSMALYSDSSDPSANGTCTSYSTDSADDPSWFLLNQNGDRMDARGGNDWAMDMGNTSYQQSCVAHTIALAKQDGFNGVFFDGINTFWSGFVPSGSTVPKYPTDSDWQAAMQSFLNYAGKTVEASGLLAVANLGTGNSTLWDQWSAPLSGSQQQGFTDGGEGLAQQVGDFSEKLANDAWNEAHDKYMIEDSYNETEAGNTFGLAAMLLVANGYSSWSTSNTDDTSSYEKWYPEYADAQQLGSPTGAYTVLSNGVYERKFQNGIVVVNPTNSAVSTFSLGGTYSGTTTPSTSSVSLPATSGLILLKSS